MYLVLFIIEKNIEGTHFSSTAGAEPSISAMIESGKPVDACLSLESHPLSLISKENIVGFCINKYAVAKGNINICNHTNANCRHCIDYFRVNFVPKPDSDARSILEIKNGTKSSVPKTKY